MGPVKYYTVDINVEDVNSATDADIENVILPYARGNYNVDGLSFVNLRTNNGGRILGLISQNGFDYGMCFMFSYYWSNLRLYRYTLGTWTTVTIS